MASLTVFTPTYNRADLLPRLYESLSRQSCKDFEWLVVDDGSTDDTESLIKSLQQKEKEFLISYIKKSNGGLQTGYVEAFKNIVSELCTCVDSDDCLIESAVEEILKFWNDTPDRNNYAGILALDQDYDGNVLGGYYPKGVKADNLLEIEFGRSVHPKSDRMLIARTDLCKKTRPAIFYPGERSLNATYLHFQISKNYDFLVYNEPLYIVEYQSEGISNNKFKHFLLSPNSFADYRLYLMSLYGAPLKFVIRNMIHYTSSCIIAKRSIFKDCNRFFLAFLCYPMGLCLTCFLRAKSKKW